jgi:transcriptional antiterminator RfaH
MIGATCGSVSRKGEAMNGPSYWNDLCWYLLRTHTKQEKRAESNIISCGIETFLPSFRDKSVNPYSGAITYQIKPFFSGYFFARFEAEKMYKKIKYARGVRDIVRFGNYPMALDEEMINLIKSRIGKDGLIQINDQICVGDRVIVKNGVFKNLVGIFERETKESDRIVILLEAIGFHAHAVIDRNLVAKLDEVARVA